MRIYLNGRTVQQRTPHTYLGGRRDDGRDYGNSKRHTLRTFRTGR